MTVWFCIPSARPVDEARACFEAWRAIGCKTAAFREQGDGAELGVDLWVGSEPYRGWAAASNSVCRAVIEADPTAAVLIGGGDDVWPDVDFPADRIEREFIEHFGGTLGVAQPTGVVPGYVPWSKGLIDGRPVQERIAWAPWLGREWCLRAYQGKGPFWEGPRHYFSDELLQLTAERLGLYWQRPDVHQIHKTWKHERGKRPPHLMHAAAHWDSDKEMFEAVKHADWPGAGLLPA